MNRLTSPEIIPEKVKDTDCRVHNFFRTLHIYNPDTDFALALASDENVRSKPYTPSKEVRLMRRSLALLPALFANPGDAILILDEKIEPALQGEGTQERMLAERAEQLAEEKNLEIVGLSQLENFARRNPGLRIEPWGWNPTLKNQLRTHGIPEASLPSDESLRSLRELSHRRLTIPFNRFMAEELKEFDCVDAAVPLEISEEKGVSEFIAANPHGFLKAPWSSSGRGVMPIDSCPEEIVRQWALGTIARQGSVLAETGADRALDFATEWCLSEGRIEFLGFSLFKTSGRARYKGNVILSQAEIISQLRIEEATLRAIVEKQRQFLEENVAPKWTGPLGIDMLIDSRGKLRPCIEVNIRRTMGHVFLSLNK